MPLQDFAVHVRARLLRFFGDPTANMFLLRSEPELERMGAKLVAGFSQDPKADVVVFGGSASFVNDGQYFGAIRASILENLKVGSAELKGAGASFGFLTEATAPTFSVSPTVDFAELVEGLARQLAGGCRGVVVVLRVEEVGNQSALQAALERLSAATGSGRVKYVVLDQRTKPRVEAFSASRDRVAVSVVQHDPSALLKAFLQSPTSRLLGLHGRGDIRGFVRWALSAVATTGPALSASGAAEGRRFTAEAPGAPSADKEKRRAHVVWVSVRFVNPWEFFDQAAKGVVDACRAVAVEGAAIATPTRVAGLSHAAAFATQVERAARLALPGRTLVVVLDPSPIADVAFLRKTLPLLAEAATSPQVKYVVVDSPETGVLPLATAAAETQVDTLHLSPESLASELERSLAKDPLSPVERVRYLSMLGGFALSRGESARSLDFSQKALEESRKLPDPAEEALAFLGLGNALYRMAEYAPARDAYAKAADLALRAKSHPLAAQSLTHVGHAHFSNGEFAQAGVAYEAAAKYQQKLANPFGEALALTWLGETRRREERWKDAQNAFEAALTCYEGVRPELSASAAEGKIEVLERFARLLTSAGLTERAHALRTQAKNLGGKGRVVDRP